MFIDNSSSELCSSFVSLKKLDKVNKPIEEEEHIYLKKVDNYFKSKASRIPKRFRLLEKYKIISNKDSKYNKDNYNFCNKDIYKNHWKNRKKLILNKDKNS